jgi:hypothetical protein
MKDQEVVQSRADSDAAAEEIINPLIRALDKKKFGPTRIACILDQAGRAKVVKHHKMTGIVEDGSLAAGHKVVATAKGLMEDEHLIQHASPNHSIRMRAADQVTAIRGLKPKEESGGIFGGATIIVYSNIAPRKRLDRDAYARIEAKKDDIDAN